MDGQRKVLADLARILEAEEVTISDGAVRADLEALLNDELQQISDIRELGRRLLGRGQDELTETEKTNRDNLAGKQDVCVVRYRRTLANIKTKAEAQPDSVFARILPLTEKTPLAERMTDAGAAIRANQFGRGITTVSQVVDALREMIGAFAGSNLAPGPQDPADTTPGVSPPPLAVLAPDAMVKLMGLSGEQAADAMGKLLKALRCLERLVERQRAVAAQAKSRAGREQTAGNLAREELDIRFQALEVATDLAVLDPQLERLIRTAAATIEQAVPPMENGPLADAVAPAELAVEQLQAAHARLSELWKDIVARIKEYSEKTPSLLVSSVMGSAQGMSAEESERMQQLVFQMLRATGALTDAIERQEALLGRTQGTGPNNDFAPLKSEQDAIAALIKTDVLPYNVSSKKVPAQIMSRMNSDASAKESLKEALDRMGRASNALDGKRKPEAAKREQESLELMGDALQVMVAVLQTLLGQFNPPGMAAVGPGGSGIPVDPVAVARALNNFKFDLQPQQLEAFQRALRGSFPQRYDRAIKTYYAAIVREGNDSAKK